MTGGAADGGARLGALAAQGMHALQTGRAEEAAGLFRQALAIDPFQPKLLQNLGGALASLGRTEAAAACFAGVIALQPGYALPYIGIGTLRQGGQRLGDAVESLGRGVRLDPGATAARFNLAVALLLQGHPDEAGEHFRRVGEALPGHGGVQSQYLVCRNCLDLPADALSAEHRRVGERMVAGIPPAAPHPNAPDPGRRLRVGYVSVDFRQHFGAQHLAPLLERHDRTAVEICLYSMIPLASGDAWTRRFHDLADLWRDIDGLDDAQLAERIRADGIDILVDLAGHTGFNRLRAFAHRPAPVQLAWLGYSNTTGVPGIDHRLVDAVSDPPGTADAQASERLVRLPASFLCFRPPAEAPPVVPLPAGRIGRITFGSFNKLPKMSDGTVRLWAEILHRVSDARLLLKDSSFACPRTKAQTEARFAAHGIAADRLTLVGWVEDPADHLGLYGQVDIALDPFPYNGTMTTCEALWMGAPVVTLTGDRHAARVGTSLLAAVGLPELAADTPEHCVAIAADLAADLSRLMRLRMGMRDRLLASPLCDEAGFARRIEATYRSLWHEWCGRARPCGQLSDP